MFTVGNSMDQMMSWIYYTLVGCMQDFNKYIGDMGAGLFDNQYVKGILLFFYLFANAMLVVGIVLAISDYAISANTGKVSFKDTSFNILKGMAVTQLFTTVPVQLYQLCVDVESDIGKILSIVGNNQSSKTIESTSLAQKAIGFFLGLVKLDPLLNIPGSIVSPSVNQQHIPSIWNVLLILVFAVAFFKILFDNLKRGAILFIQVCVCPLYIFSLVRGYTDGFIGWCKQIIALCFTAFLQNIMLVLGMMMFHGNQDGAFIIGVGIMLAASEVPRIAGHYGLDTSVKTHISSIAYTTNSIMSLGRTFLK